MAKRTRRFKLEEFDPNFSVAPVVIDNLVLTLPPPPSVWGLYKTGRHRQRYKSKNYKAWLTYAHLITGKPGSFNRPVAIRLSFYGGNGFRKGRDLDNCEKALLDFLCQAKIIEDDSFDHVPKIVKTYYPPSSSKEKAFVRISIRSI